MTTPTAESMADEGHRWWSTSIIDIEPGNAAIRGCPIEELIGSVSYPQMVWLMLRGELPGTARARLFKVAMLAAVDHGPQGPSIAISRMATTCRLPINGAMASAINALDAFISEHGKVIPGFGHRWHDIDPRAVRLPALTSETRQAGQVDGRFTAVGSTIEQVLTARKATPIPMNIDGASAVLS